MHPGGSPDSASSSAGSGVSEPGAGVVWKAMKGRRHPRNRDSSDQTASSSLSSSTNVTVSWTGSFVGVVPTKP